MIKDVGALVKYAAIEIRKQTDIAVIGLSGGADSTLCALLCVEALGAENVYGVHMPYNNLDEDTFNSNSNKLADHLNIQQLTIQIGPAVEELSQQFSDGEGMRLSTVNSGNMRSRMRMVSLYTLCWQVGNDLGERARVIGTGNLSEDFIGYDTKGGDALCDFFPIGSLFKSEVYQALEYFRDQGTITEEMIDRVPSAGLWDSQTDEEELGYTYNEMEPSIRMALDDGGGDLRNPIDMFVYDMHVKNKHKHEAPMAIELRHLCE